MKSKKNTFFIYFLYAGSIILIIISILVFLKTFYKSSLSNTISDWGNFGSYFSIIISLLNLIVLVYITNLVGNKTNETTLLIRRMNVYNKLTDFLPTLNRVLPDIELSMRLMFKFLDETKNPKKIEYDKMKKELFNNFNYFNDFYFFLFTFKASYGYLFEYDFNSKRFNDMLKNAEYLKVHFKSVKENLLFGGDNIDNLTLLTENTKDMFNGLTDFLNSLNNELK